MNKTKIYEWYIWLCYLQVGSFKYMIVHVSATPK